MNPLLVKFFGQGQGDEERSLKLRASSVKVSKKFYNTDRTIPVLEFSDDELNTFHIPLEVGDVIEITVIENE